MSTKFENSRVNAPKLSLMQPVSILPLSSHTSDDQNPDQSLENQRITGSPDSAEAGKYSRNPFRNLVRSNLSNQIAHESERYHKESSRRRGKPVISSPENQSIVRPKFRNNSRERKQKLGLNIVTDFSKSSKHALDEAVISSKDGAQLRAENGGADLSTLQPPGIVHHTASDGSVKEPCFVGLHDLEIFCKDKESKNLPKTTSRPAENTSKARKVGQAERLQAEERERGRNLERKQTQGTSLGIKPSKLSNPSKVHGPTITNPFRPPIVKAQTISSLPTFHKIASPALLPSVRRSFDTWEIDSQYSDTPISSGTLIDEDDGRQTEGRPLSTNSDEAILPSGSDTGRPRSKGWWNLMLSPMLSRSGTNTTRQPATPQEKPPALPTRSSNIHGGSTPDDNDLMTAISPQTLRRAGSKDVRDSTWSNWAQWEYNREQAAGSEQSLYTDDEAHTHSPRTNEPSHDRPIAVEYPGENAGLAAEYYQASAFDLPNVELYFQCVDHDCARSLPKLVGSGKTSLSSMGTEEAQKSTVVAPAAERALEKKGLLVVSRSRPDSDSTIIEDEPIRLSPNLRKAHAKPIVKAGQVQEIEASKKQDVDEKDTPRIGRYPSDKSSLTASHAAIPPPYSPPPEKRKVPRYVSVQPPSRQLPVSNPGPISPEGQKILNQSNGIPMSQVQQPRPVLSALHTYAANRPPPPAATHVSLPDIENPAEIRRKAEGRRHFLEREDAAAHRAGGLWRGRGCIPESGCFGRPGRAGRIRRRWYAGITTGFVLIIILIVVLATQLTRRADETPVQSQWLNLTGYPPMPTGISTIARPNAAEAVTACVKPSSLWSCALPREDQITDSPNDADQPNFRLEIRFRNGTVDANDTIPLPNRKRTTGTRGGTLLSRQDDAFTNSLFEPSPAPPSLAEQTFLGNTTDNITADFSGETTPFFISLLSSDPTLPEDHNETTELSKRWTKRQLGSGRGSIPAPAVLDDGTAAPANLLPDSPLPSSQPVKLYDRGLDTEHYGFYTYFERSIFLKRSAQFTESTSSNRSEDEIDTENENGGSTIGEADLRCTWSETRFMVRIWTNPTFAGRLLDSATNESNTSAPDSAHDDDDDPTKTKSSATDFHRPGSLPYPVTITLDRHGGDSAKKGVYCYGMDGRQQQQKIVVSDKTIVAEVRGAGGPGLINPAKGIFSTDGDGDGEGGGGDVGDVGGIDGGTGGCRCEWRNWSGE